MTKTSRARYTLEFKQEAARLVEAGQSIAAAARTLGVVEQTLFNWVKAQRQGKLKGIDSMPLSAEQMENSRLRAELARVKIERDNSGKSDGVLRKGVDLKYAFIQRHRKVWPISVQCRVLEVSVAGYHEHFVRQASHATNARQRRHLRDDALLVNIKAIHAESRCLRLAAHLARVGGARYPGGQGARAKAHAVARRQGQGETTLQGHH